MIIDYLGKLETMNIETLPKTEREAFITVLCYLEKRERNPALLNQIYHNINRLTGAGTEQNKKR